MAVVQASTWLGSPQPRAGAAVGYNAAIRAATEQRDAYGYATYPESRAFAESMMAADGCPEPVGSCLG